MAQDSTHPDYDDALPKWELIQDVLDGEDAVKEAGSKYLPTFEESESEDWQKYKKRADFFEVTSRCRAAMIGFLFRRDPRMKVPGVDLTDKRGDKASTVVPLDGFIKDATLTTKEFYDVAKDIARLVAAFGRCGTLIDWSEDDQHPFVTLYKAQDIINWHYERINGRLMLTMVMLQEWAIINKDDYELDFEPRWRELRLIGEPVRGYQVESYLWKRKEIKGGSKGGAQTAEFVLDGEPIVPTRRKVPLTEIPFVFHTAEGPHGEYICPPPLLGMSRLNLSLYRTSADKENALHTLGMPTPWAAGFEDEGDKLYLGSTKAWTTGEPNARCGFLALQGSDLAPLSEAKKEKMEEMAQLGARMLDPSIGSQPEAYATVALRQTGETASLVDISLALTQSLTEVMAWALWWSSNIASVNDARLQAQYVLNTDFVAATLDAPTVTAMFSMYLQRGISFESLFWKLQGAEFIPADRTVEQEKALIAKGESLLLGMAGESQNNGNGQNGDGNQNGNENDRTKKKENAGVQGA